MDNRPLNIELGAHERGHFEAPIYYGNPQKLQILYEEYLSSEYNRFNLPVELTEKRNLALKALFAQAISTLTGFGFFFYRKMVAYLVINLISSVLIYLGAEGVLRLDKSKIAVHSVVTMGVLGTCFVYFLFEALFTNVGYREDQGEHPPERVTLFFLSLPYLVDLVCGALSFSLTISVYQLEEAKKKLTINEGPRGGLFDPDESYKPESKYCLVCLTFKKSCVIYPCGHLILCNLCLQTFKDQRIQNCPVCRNPIKDIIQAYS